ncbi:hypothetical protein CB1_001616050 [Camelus ferus]|nr:hypothetical protein CB1_001616050 [Camelus ferus]
MLERTVTIYCIYRVASGTIADAGMDGCAPGSHPCQECPQAPAKSGTWPPALTHGCYKILPGPDFLPRPTASPASQGPSCPLARLIYAATLALVQDVTHQAINSKEMLLLNFFCSGAHLRVGASGQKA